jgi:uncharacterized protein
MHKAVGFVVGLGLAASLAVFSAHASVLRHGIAAYNRQDYAVAAANFLDLARRGNVKAQTYLGFMYSTGQGVPQNFVAAAGWYTCAAERGDPLAQLMLGQLYENGQGVPENYVEAHMWLNLGAAHAAPKIRDFGVKMRDAIATKMTRRELAKSRLLALEWGPSRSACEIRDVE